MCLIKAYFLFCQIIPFHKEQAISSWKKGVGGQWTIQSSFEYNKHHNSKTVSHKWITELGQILLK